MSVGADTVESGEGAGVDALADLLCLLDEILLLLASTLYNIFKFGFLILEVGGALHDTSLSVVEKLLLAMDLCGKLADALLAELLVKILILNLLGDGIELRGCYGRCSADPRTSLSGIQPL